MNAREKKRLDLVTQQKKRVYRFSHRNSRDGMRGEYSNSVVRCCCRLFIVFFVRVSDSKIVEL